MVKTTTVKDEKNRLRKEMLEAHAGKKLSKTECASRLGMSASGFMKLYARYRLRGLSCLSHGLCGKPPNRKPKPEKENVLALAGGKYKDFGIKQSCELLREREGLAIHQETLRLWLVADGKPVAKRRKLHRARRERKPCFGEMLQIDGSFHDWLGDGSSLCMINITDDATSACMARFDAQETIESVCRRLWRWMQTHGVPKSVYADGRNLPHHRQRAREFLHRHVPTARRRHNPRPLAANQGKCGARERHTPGVALLLLQLDVVKDMDALNDTYRDKSVKFDYSATF